MENTIPEDVSILGNPSLLYALLRNLVENSLRYAGNGVTIHLECSVYEGVAHFFYYDTGKGVSDEHLGKIFERFYRTDASRNSSKGGSGIGLSIVKKIMEDHGGQVWATSKEGTGTTMYLALRKYQEVPVHE